MQLMKAGDWRDARSTARYIAETERFEDTTATKVLGHRPQTAARAGR